MQPLNQNRVVVAMSGGVDSSVAALLLKKQGYEVIGISMKLHESQAKNSCEKTCCSADDIEDARRVAARLDIPFYSLNYAAEFKKAVMDPFIQSYQQGFTPNPCIACNKELKFATLLQEAARLEAPYLATGHYARKTGDSGNFKLYCGRDGDKDQSYFLFNLTQDQLEHILFPLGDLTKAEVRSLAREAGLETSEKKESQEICFVPGNDLAAFMNRQVPEEKRRPGKIVTTDGDRLGEHGGIHTFTIGQRRGLGVAVGERRYVSEIRPETGEVVLGKNEDLFKKVVIAHNPSFVSQEALVQGLEVTAKVRYRQEAAPAKLYFDETGPIKVIRAEFLEPQRAIAPGQAIVFYKNDQVLGGAWIERGI